MKLEMLDEILRIHSYEESGLIAMLQDIQREERYLPESELRLMAERVGVPASRAYSLATFYKSFSLEPRGRHLVSVCLGTACHVRGGARVMDRITRNLGVEPGGTTEDMRFTVEPVRCLGCCGLAPSVMIDGDFHGQVKQNKVPMILREYE